MQYPYIYAFKRAVLFGKRGSPLYRQYCRVLRRGAKNSVLVEFEDGAWHVVSRNALRKRAQIKSKKGSSSYMRAKDYIPDGYRKIEAYTNGREIVALEWPEDDDENHNCDCLGCSGLDHVKYRVAIPDWQQLQRPPSRES